MEEKPRLRALDLVPVQAQGQRAFLLRDPQGLGAQELLLPADLAFLVSLFDGQHTLREVQLGYVRRFGTLVTTGQIADLARKLDEALLLDSERFRQHRAGLEAEFRARPTRAMAHAGQSYPAAAGELVRTWEPQFAQAALPEDFRLDGHRPALVAPHYDMRGAADCYAAAYRLLAAGPRPQVVVMLGVAHAGGEAPFVLTRKPYETPLGALEVDRELVEALLAQAPGDPLAEEFLHRDEHSIEFGAVLLHALYREGEPPRLVPILCGGFHQGEAGVVDPGEREQVTGFLQVLQGLLAADSRRIALLAAADLGHVGARFGDPPVSQPLLELLRRHDHALLERLQAGDLAGLHQVLAGEQDRFHVCGFPALWALGYLAGPKEGRLLHYHQAVEPQTQSCVSFAAVGLR